jgi:four helix bundle protein
MVQGAGFVRGSGCWVLGAGFCVLGSVCWVLGAGFWVLGSGCWVLRAGFCVLGSGFWVLGSGFGTLDALPWCMGARHYRELICWQLASDLKRRVYALTAKRLVARDRRFCEQIRDSARGGPRAVAEGFGRFRPGDFARYLEFARASLIETQNHLDDALDCSYLTHAEHTELFKLGDRAIGAVTRLHGYLHKRQDPRDEAKKGIRSPNGNDLPTVKPKRS